ncbi:MAG: dephospho-CoA kinase [Anaerolineae bacterium]|nr:dephospho-CoA kinase [Anaerolineae bacterium]
MSAWPGKKVIGLTGNIATGKSVVRKMLEHLDVYGIDADALSHRVIAKGSPGYEKTVETFGKWIVGENGEVDRTKLGSLVFSDAEALAQLEAIVHPLVRKAVDHLVSQASQKVIVIEAIKLLESPLREACDTVWVTTATEEQQIQRLKEKRGMDEAEARKRMAAQSTQTEKMAAADVVIDNSGSFEETWEIVRSAWRELQPQDERDSSGPIPVAKHTTGSLQRMEVLRARPRQAEDIATFINRMNDSDARLSSFDVMAAFGEKAYMLLMIDNVLKGLVGWKVENLVARTDEIYLEEKVNTMEALSFLVGEVENASKELQCEASLIFVNKKLSREKDLWEKLGYQSRSIESLAVNAWQTAARESQEKTNVMMFKQLRVDRVLRPI